MGELFDSGSVDRLWAMSTDDVVAVFDAAMAGINEQTAVALRALREVEGRAVPDRDGAMSTAGWVRSRHRVSIATATRFVRAATALDAAPPALQDAVDAGAVNLDQAEVITRALGALPHDLGGGIRDRAAKEMARLSAEFGPVELRAIGERILHVVAPEAADEADRIALERAEARAGRERHVTITADRGGAGYRLTGRLTNEQAAVLRAAIDPLCAPATSAGRGGTVRGVADERSAGQRRADALVEICRLALNTTTLPRNGGDRPQVVVTIPYDVLTRELGAGTLDTGERITAESARRIACDCRLLPIVFGGQSQPLDVGRMKRLVTGALRQALIARDRGCAFPGCDRGARWTDAHHVVPWSAGGATALANTVLLCGRHHTAVHRPGGWSVHIARDGLPTFIPPPQADPEQKPRRNRYHLRP